MNAENEVKLTLPISFSLNFPDELPNEIFRESVIATISRQFDSGKQFICIECEEGMGKTTVLKQFAERYQQSAFASFINPIRGVILPQDFVLHDLHEQLDLYGNAGVQQHSTNIDVEKYSNTLFLAKRQQKKKRDILYFIVDGLEYVHDDASLEKIIKLLPIGDQGVKVLVSGNAARIEKLIAGRAAIQQLTLFSFTIDESAKVFDESQKYSKEDLRLVWQAANEGQPGKLRDLFRLVAEQKRSVSDFLSDLEQMSVIYEVDWKRLNEIDDDMLNRIVAFTALDDRIYTVNSLAKLFDCDDVEITKAIEQVSFLRILINSEIEFTAHASRQFFAKKLADYRKLVLGENIRYLLKNQDTLEALTGLPKYYSSSSDYDGLMNLLTASYFPKLIRASQTLTAVGNSIQLGYVAAKKSGADEKLFDFALFGSLIQNIEGLHIWDSEIDARIELGDYDKAIQLANSALLQEDRLTLLVRIAKLKKKKKEIVEEALSDQIAQLFQVVDLKTIGDKSIQITVDLFYVNSSLAIKFIQDTSLKDSKSVSDWLLTRLTRTSIDTKGTFENDVLDSTEKTGDFVAALAELFGNYSYEHILRETSQLKDSKGKILLLRLWIEANPKSPEISNAINFALDDLIKNNSKEYSQPSLLSDLIYPLRFFTDKTSIDSILDRVLKFKEEARKFGYTVDYYAYMLNAIRAKAISNADFAIGWFNELSTQLDYIDDSIVRAECLADLVNTLYDIKGFLEADRHGYLFDMLNSKLKNLIKDIFDRSAYHYENVRDIIFTIAFNDIEFAIEISQKANTTVRRDLLMRRALQGYLKANNERINIRVVERIQLLIADDFIRDRCLRDFLVVVSRAGEVSDGSMIMPFLTKNIVEVRSMSTRCYVLCLILTFLLKRPDGKKMGKPFFDQLNKAWDGLDSDVVKIETGFRIASMLSEVDQKVANDFLQKADAIKRGTWVDSLNTINIYTVYCNLLIKAFSGLIKKRSYDDRIFNLVVEVVSSIPDPSARVRLWAYLASVAHLKGDLTLRERIFTGFVKQSFESCSDEYNRNLLLVEYGYLFFINSQIGALERIQSLPASMREDAIEGIIKFLLYDTIPDEPFDPNDKAFKDGLSFDDIWTVCELLGRLEEDLNVYTLTASLVDACLDVKATQIQRETVRKSLESIIIKKLPNKNYIQHDGYKIISLASILKLERDPKIVASKFDQLVSDLESSVKNISDKAFVYSVLGDLIPSLKGVKHTQNSFVNKAFATLDALFIRSEEISRVELFVSRLHDVNPALWKTKLEYAFRRTLSSGSDGDIRVQRRLLDDAYRYDPLFAKSLVNLLDDDEVRIEYRRKRGLSAFYESLHLRKQIIDDRMSGDKKQDKIFAQACYQTLGLLNSGRISSKRANQMRTYLEHAIRIPIMESFSIYSFYLENLIRRNESTAEGKSQFTVLVESLYGVCKVTEVLVERYKSDTIVVDTKIDLTSARKRIFKVGERDLALSYLKDWLIQNPSKYIKICDPFFGPEELDFLKLIMEVSKDVRIHVMTSVEAKGNTGENVEDRYDSYWRSISDEDPPKVRISITRIKRSNLRPFHDRWILLERAGLVLGNSLNGLGSSKISQIVELNDDDRIAIEKDVFDPLFSGDRVEFNGERVASFSFSLV